MDFKSFVIELTADGSPTLRLKNLNESHPGKMPESMHHSGGAAAETLYIYTEPFKNSLKALAEIKQSQLSIGVVGLGLGYIELSILQNLCVKPAISATLTSFEKESELSEAFIAWFGGRDDVTYDLICKKLSIDKKDIVEYSKSKSWNILGELSLKTAVSEPFNFVAYDAFSQFTDGPLWTDEFLDYFLSYLCAKDCVFTTYACTGNLKRALQRNDFLFIKRPGFSGKRDATLALRGGFKSLQCLFQSV